MKKKGPTKSGVETFIDEINYEIDSLNERIHKMGIKDIDPEVLEELVNKNIQVQLLEKACKAQKETIFKEIEVDGMLVA